MHSPDLYAECWCCGKRVKLYLGGSGYRCESCDVAGSIIPGVVTNTFAAQSIIFRGAEGRTTNEPYIDHSEEHMPSPA